MIQILRHPDGEEGGGKKEENAAAGAEEIGALKHQLEEAKKSQGDYQKLQTSVGALFNPGATEEQRQAALSNVMVAGGVSESDVQNMVADILGGEGEETGEEVKPVEQNQNTEQQKQQVPHPLEAAVKDLTSQVQEMRGSAEKNQQAQSKEALQKSVDHALQTSPDANDIISRLTAARGKEHAEKVAGLLRKDVLRETLENLYARKAQVGQFNAAWIPEEAAKAATATLEKAKSLMVTDSVGKAPGVLDEAVMLSELANKEIKPPVHDKKLSKAEQVEAVDNWTVQRLQQMAAQHAVKAAQGGESKA